ncbi:transcriptional regulator, putative [Talaromyces stipitatus ATCC 10500]|uniref:Transcriptional regulator, putative n=1 Tax=Talaromyces stipitatus (strain ATCC 10500 / CBS 375.48 / QM 6759 / NRRL 1006) TaxID=441959 RepID=B8M951_TALSN|nr:transcriptional regulator, putative [Talaromyces stipitatus ATCC 10500]EED17346.1 transcriptional regulator, putative [Talaromyces stipitatus ATCC 10500]
MYLRTVHAEGNLAILQEFVKQNPLGILNTALKSTVYPFIQSSHIPFVFNVDTSATGHEDNQQGYGVLRGHIAKQNPQAKVLIETLAATQTELGDETIRELPEDVLVLFNGPHHHYVTPKFYVETKPTTGKVVPTWNYSAVQVYGKVEDLSRQAETSIMGYTGGGNLSPWEVSDAPVSYIDILKKNIIGIEIRIHRMEGKFKLSQEMGKGDREGVIQGFDNLNSDVGRNMAEMVKDRGNKKDEGA